MIEGKIYDTIPEGWKVIKNATRHPKGMVWITDGKSMFDPTHRIALWKNSTLIQDAPSIELHGNR